MLQKISLENFKGFKKAQLDLGKITVLIGPNGTGKSSISQALMVLRQSLGHQELRVNGPLINLGNFNDVMNKGASQMGIGLSIGIAEYPDLDIRESASYSYNAYFDPKVISFDATISSLGKEYLEVEKAGRTTATVHPQKFTKKDLPSGEISVTLTTQRTIARPLSIKSSSQSGGLDDELNTFVEETNELLSAIDILLSNTYYVHAIRGLDQPTYALATEPSTDFAAGQNLQLASTFAYAGRDVEEIVSIWSETITGSELGPKVLPGRLVAIKSYVVPGGIPVCGDGSGTNQLVQLLLTLAVTPKQSLLCIEEPEIHLHPKAQTKLCNILLEIAKAQDKQLVITTHSQYVLFTFVQAVKRGTLTQDELAIYYFEEKGEEPQRVEQDEYGDIYDWGKNFFSLP